MDSLSWKNTKTKNKTKTTKTQQ